jgi:DNA polymerase III subunit delta'
MLALLKTASGLETFAGWMKYSEAIAARRAEKLEWYLEALYSLIDDVIRLGHGMPEIRNRDIRGEIEALARKVSFAWLQKMVERVDELVELGRRNIQKTIALDALAVER